MSKRILIVDDEQKLCEQLRRFFEAKGFGVFTCYDGGSAIELVRSTEVDVVLLDLRLPDLSGMEVLQQIKGEYPGTGVIIITGHGDVDTAVNAIQLRADNFVLKPVNLKTLLAVVERVLESYDRQQEVLFLRGRLSEIRGQKVKQLLLPPDIMETVKLLADNPATNVLILGETGTGKGMVANAIHELSPRSGAQLVDLNCAGLAGNLLESELFGHEKGAFTDAKKTKRGLLEIAHQGSLFLDEVGDMSLEVQAKLLKVIEERRFRRLGGTVNVDVDVRLMAATHVELDKAVKAGTFRSDLFYRLSVMPVSLPPLRARRGDIVPLTNLFLKEFSGKFGKSVLRCARETESMLEAYGWPGNVRELRNVLERAVLLCNGATVEPRHLPENLRTQARSPRYVEGMDYSLESVEAMHIRRILTECENNRSRAAKLLGIHRTTLLSKISKYNLDD